MFQVPIVMLSLSRIFDDAPVAYLTPPSWCTAEGAVLVDPGGDRSGVVWYGCVLSSHGESWAKYNLTEPIPLQAEHVAVEPPIWPMSSYYEDMVEVLLVLEIFLTENA